MHEQRRPDKTIRVPLQDPAERPCELNHGLRESSRLAKVPRFCREP
jgi:hypothetical protein